MTPFGIVEFLRRFTMQEKCLRRRVSSTLEPCSLDPTTMTMTMITRPVSSRYTKRWLGLGAVNLSVVACYLILRRGWVFSL